MSIPHYSLFPHSRHVDVMQTAYQPQGNPDHVPASAVIKQQPLDGMGVLATTTSDSMLLPTTIGTSSRRSTCRPEAQVLPSRGSMLPSLTTLSPSRPPPRHHKSKSAPNVRPRPSIQSPSSSTQNIVLESPLAPSPAPLIRRKTVTNKQSETGLVLNATPALEPLPRWSPYYCSNPDAETPTRRARNSTLPNDKRSFGARAVAAGMVPPSLVPNDQHRTCDSPTVTSPMTPVAKEKRGLFRKSRSFGMLRRSTISHEDQVTAWTVPVPPLPVTPHHLPLPTPASPMSMSHTIDRSQHRLPSDITTPARTRPHLDLSTTPPPLILPSSSDAWSPTSVSPSSPTPTFLNQQTYFLSSPPIPPRQSSKRVAPSSAAHDARVYFTGTSAEPINMDSGEDLASSPSFSLRTTASDVDSRSFDSRMLYGASPSASLASVASTLRSRGRTKSHSASGQLRSPRKQRLPSRLDMPLPPLSHSPPSCLPPSRPIPPIPVASTTAAPVVLSVTNTPIPAPGPATATATAPFPSTNPTPINYNLRRAASDAPAPAPALQSYWDTDADSVFNTPKSRPSSMPIWRKVKAGLHLAKRSWEKGMSAGSSGNGSGSGSGSFSESCVSEEECGRDGTKKRMGREEAGAWFF